MRDLTCSFCFAFPIIAAVVQLPGIQEPPRVHVQVLNCCSSGRCNLGTPPQGDPRGRLATAIGRLCRLPY
jgi:hypothetical protein